jgi:hypothetical protein
MESGSSLTEPEFIDGDVEEEPSPSGEETAPAEEEPPALDMPGEWTGVQY